MIKRAILMLVVAALLLVVPAKSTIFETTLENGLRVVLHQEDGPPIVGVAILYGVGSAHEDPNKTTGFGHIFEHLLFEGTDNFPGEYADYFEPRGTWFNGTTSNDRTAYYLVGPSNVLPLALAVFADQMSHPLLDPKRLEVQKGVVVNELLQRYNRPYMRALTHLGEAFPDDHPYDHSVGGYVKHVKNADAPLALAWYRTFYTPNNSAIYIFGDFDIPTALGKIDLYFGDIPQGPDIPEFPRLLLQETGSRVVHDNVRAPRVMKIWNIPSAATRAAIMAELAVDMLSRGMDSPLSRQLVDPLLATDCMGFYIPGKMASQVFLWATAYPETGLDELEEMLNKTLRTFQEEGPTYAQLARTKKRLLVQGRRYWDYPLYRVFEWPDTVFYSGDPEYLATREDVIENATAAEVRAATEWLGAPGFTFEILPGDPDPLPEPKTVSVHPAVPRIPMIVPMTEPEAAGEKTDHFTQPDIGDFPEPSAPEVSVTTLENGLRIVHVFHETELAWIRVIVKAGRASDNALTMGTTMLLGRALYEGTATLNRIELQRAVEDLGSELEAYTTLDYTRLTLVVLPEDLSQATALLSDLVINPEFPADAVDRLRRQQLAEIERNRMSPDGVIFDAIGDIVYGGEHPYGIPFIGAGTLETVARISRDTLLNHHTTWFRPRNTTVIVLSEDRLSALTAVQGAFESWEDRPVPTLLAGRPLQQSRTGSAVYLIDRPGSFQTSFVGVILVPVEMNRSIAFASMDEILGGPFGSRLNMHVREVRGATYGVRSDRTPTRYHNPYLVWVSVENTRTAESLMALEGILDNFGRDEQPTREEVKNAAEQLRIKTVLGWVPGDDVLETLTDAIRAGHDPGTFFTDFLSGLRNTDYEQSLVAARHVSGAPRSWIVSGDLSEIGRPLVKTGIPIYLIKADGEPDLLSADDFPDELPTEGD